MQDQVFIIIKTLKGSELRELFIFDFNEIDGESDFNILR